MKKPTEGQIYEAIKQAEIAEQKFVLDGEESAENYALTTLFYLYRRSQITEKLLNNRIEELTDQLLERL